MVVLATAQTTATGDDDLGGAKFRPFGFGEFSVGEGGLLGVGGRGDVFNFCGISGVDRNRVKGGAADGDDFDRVGALYGGECIAGVDRANEGVGGFDTGDFGDLGDVEQGGDTRREVFAEGGGRARMWL